MWHFTPNEIYTVKFGYKVRMHFIKQSVMAQETSNTSHELHLWNSIRKLHIQPKIRLFLWRVVQNILPTRRHRQWSIGDHTICIHCEHPIEINRYVFFDYEFAKNVWNYLPLGRKWLQITAQNFKDLFHSIVLQYDLTDVGIFATCTSLIWYARNKLFHDGNCSSENLIVVHALSLSEEYMKINLTYHSSLIVHSTGSFPRIWKPPNPGDWKSNTDVSFSKGNIGIDILVRTHLEIPLLAKALPRWDDIP